MVRHRMVPNYHAEKRCSVEDPKKGVPGDSGKSTTPENVFKNSSMGYSGMSFDPYT